VILVSSTNISRTACARWQGVEPNDSLDGVHGVVDHYRREVQPGATSEPDATFARSLDRLWRYEVFPPSVMQPIVCSEDGILREGTTIVQRVAIGPLRIEPAVRVLRVWRTANADTEEAGFTYATLPGHPERGTSSFWVTHHNASGRTYFAIEARSQPGPLLYRLGRPLARRFQRRATLAALDYFARS
jgi:uncharacterized protein (UPF0548 family)